MSRRTGFTRAAARALLAASLAAALPAAAHAAAFAPDRILRGTGVVPAPIDSVWAAWTTEAGIRAFFAPGAHVEPRVDGAYEIFFDPSAAPGSRGADDMRVLAFEPPHRLAFTWNAPPQFAHVRGQRTFVVIELDAVDAAHTRLRFTQSGWGTGPEWDAVYDYFDQAWNGYVLPALVYRFRHGPIGPTESPALKPFVRTLKQRLAPAGTAPAR